MRRIALRELDQKREKYIWKYSLTNLTILRKDEDRYNLTLSLEDLLLDCILFFSEKRFMEAIQVCYHLCQLTRIIRD